MFKGYLKQSTIIGDEVKSNIVLVIEDEDFNKVSNKLLETWGANKWIEGSDGKIYREIEQEDPNDPDYVLLTFSQDMPVCA